jgi:hypothetical protein
MDKILTGNIWKQVAPLANRAKRRLLAVAYVSSDRYLKLRRNDILVCDASDHAIQAGETSASILKSLVRKGAEVRCRPDLHAKVAVLGRIALVGSCNLSASSEEDLTELALLSDRKQIVAQATAFIHNLREASERIGDDFLRRILKLKVHRGQRRRRRRQGKKIQFGNKVWLVSVRQLPEDSFPKEQPFVEQAEKKAATLAVGKDSTISWIRWTGGARFRSAARPGDIVVQIWKSLSGKRITVYPPCPIVLRQDVAHWTRFYVAELEDCQTLSRKRFAKTARKHGLSHFSKESVRELSPREVLVLEGLWPWDRGCVKTAAHTCALVAIRCRRHPATIGLRLG